MKLNCIVSIIFYQSIYQLIIVNSFSTKIITTNTNHVNIKNKIQATKEPEISISEKDVPQLPPLSKNAKRVFYIRHGEVINPFADKGGGLYGAMDVSLSTLGEQEARVAGLYLQRFKIDHVASSPLRRAIFGANQVLTLQKEETRGKSVEIYNGFSELDRGDWCGKTKAELASEIIRFENCDESVTPKGGESLNQLKFRVLKARDELLKTMNDGETAALVSHLQVTRSILSDAFKIPTEEMSALKILTASIACIDYYSNADDDVTVHFSNFKPEAGLEASKDAGNFV